MDCFSNRQIIRVLSIGMLFVVCCRTVEASLINDLDGIDGFYALKVHAEATKENSINYFDPLNGFVPAGYGNSNSPNDVLVTDPGIEFAFDDTNTLVTAEITANRIKISQVPLRPSSSTPKAVFLDDIDFITDSNPGGGIQVELLSNSFPGMTWGYDAHSLFFKSVGSSNYNGNGGGSVPNEGWHIEFEISAANPVPEPATVAVWSVLGLCGVGYGLRRKKRKTS